MTTKLFGDFAVPKVLADIPQLEIDYNLSDVKGLTVFTFCGSDGLIYVDVEDVEASQHKESRLNGDVLRFEFCEMGMGLDWYGSNNLTEFVTWLNNRIKHLAIQQIRDLICDQEQSIEDLKRTVSYLESL